MYYAYDKTGVAYSGKTKDEALQKAAAANRGLGWH